VKSEVKKTFTPEFLTGLTRSFSSVALRRGLIQIVELLVQSLNGHLGAEVHHDFSHRGSQKVDSR